MEKLLSLLEHIRQNTRLPMFDEAATKQAVVLPLLDSLGWSVFNVEEVIPEFSVENRRVDFALRGGSHVRAFLEVKKSSEDLESHEEQLLEYSFRQGVELAVLTNGITWWFYLPQAKGSWKERRFYAIDIVQQNAGDAAGRFVELLSKPKMLSGDAFKSADNLYQGNVRRHAIASALPSAWNKLVHEANSALLELIADATERLCGHRPDCDEVATFLRSQVQEVGLPVRIPARVRQSREQRTEIRRQQEGDRARASSQIPMEIGQKELVPVLVRILQNCGGAASKGDVEKAVYSEFRGIFSKRQYQELVSNGVPRWQHNLAWAKERAKKLGFVKWPHESGRGMWELTTRGMKASF